MDNDGGDGTGTGPDDNEDATAAYEQQLAVLRGETTGGGAPGGLTLAPVVKERVPIVVEKKYAIKSKAARKSKLDDDVNAVAVTGTGGKKKKKKEEKTEDFNAEDYEDVSLPPCLQSPTCTILSFIPSF